MVPKGSLWDRPSFFWYPVERLKAFYGEKYKKGPAYGGAAIMIVLKNLLSILQPSGKINTGYQDYS